jgi:PhnB protein
MATTNSYLNFNGNCEEAFNYYQTIFGGQVNFFGRFKDMPTEDGMEIPSEFGNRVMHVSLTFDNGHIIMGSDSFEGCGGEGYRQGNNISVSINTESQKEADRLFDGLSKEGSSIMPMDHAFWGDYFGAVTDRFGINWMISFAENQHQF